MDLKYLGILLALGAAVQARNHGYGDQYSNYQPVNGGWSAYGAYSECNVDCGKGDKTRTRTCTNPAPAYGGADCYGDATETAECYAGHCPVDGGWSAYGKYSECNVDCGKGEKTRTRTCTNPAPAYGGADCYGDATETAECDAGYCPVDGGWSAYGEYSECNVKCGKGQKTRTRTCTYPAPAYGGNDCYGDATETKECHAGHCPVDGGWSDYGDYSPCSVQCGNGIQTRTRTCTKPAPAYGGADCEGDAEETKSCYSGYRCPIHGGWSAYGDYSACSKTCGGGQKTSYRICNNPAPRYGGNPCEGDSEKSKPCNTHSCPISYY